MAPLPGLVAGRMDVGTTTLLWATAPSAPVSTHEQEDGCALLIGDAIPRGASRRLSAREMSDAWMGRDSLPAAYDGFHVGIAVRDGAITIGGDILGLFPIYYSALGDVWLAGSSSATFDGHPLFTNSLDVESMLGYLLAGGPFDGRTLNREVRRLAAGALLRWARGAARETEHYVLPSARVDGVASFATALERYDAHLATAVRRHSGVHNRLTLLLSGGRDSRLLAGYLARAGVEAHAVTLGRATDHDAMCAAGVARALGMRQVLSDIPFRDFPDYADRATHWERLAGGMSSVHSWGTADILGEHGGAVISGYVLEARQIAPLPRDVSGMLQWTHAHAIGPDLLRTLVTEALRPQVDAALQSIRTRMAGMSEMPESEADGERSWRWLVAGYARFHSGAIPWRLSFGAWPVLPILDQAFIETMLSMPSEYLASRRMQDAVLRARFPRLARVPLDSNSNDVRALVPTLAQRIRAAWGVRTEAGDGIERRYYARIYDFANDGWRAIRHAAEPGRNAMLEWFDRASLAAVVPSPSATVAHADPVTDGFGPKMLTGIMRGCVTGEIAS